MVRKPDLVGERRYNFKKSFTNDIYLLPLYFGLLFSICVCKATSSFLFFWAIHFLNISKTISKVYPGSGVQALLCIISGTTHMQDQHGHYSPYPLAYNRVNNFLKDMLCAKLEHCQTMPMIEFTPVQVVENLRHHLGAF